MSSRTEPRIPLPKTWNKHVRSSVLKVISLAQFAVTYTRGWGADSINSRLRQKTELERLTATVALLREEIRIKDVRPPRYGAVGKNAAGRVADYSSYRFG